MNRVDIQLQVAELSDIDDVLDLHYRYQVDSIADEDRTKRVRLD